MLLPISINSFFDTLNCNLCRSGFSLTAALLKSNTTSLNFRPVYVVDESKDNSVRLIDNILLMPGFDEWGLGMTVAH
jgi:hypothetical protein